jgi:hypothetical protein
VLFAGRRYRHGPARRRRYAGRGGRLRWWHAWGRRRGKLWRFPRRFHRQCKLESGCGADPAGFIGLGLPNGLVTNGVGFPPSNLVSFPFGLGPPSIPLVSPNGFGFPNGLGVLNFNNGFFLNRGFNNGWYGGIGGWGYGIGGIGLLSPDSSYTPGYNYFAYDQPYARYQPSPNVAVVSYSPQPAVQPLSAERAVHSVIREYDQSGREIASTGALSSSVPQAYPAESAVQPLSAERAVHSVIREYDQSGREIPPVGFPLYLIAFADHTIHTAISYRVDGNTLNYVTPDREQKAVPLNTIDRGLSTQLNRERQVFFELPQ